MFIKKRRLLLGTTFCCLLLIPLATRRLENRLLFAGTTAADEWAEPPANVNVEEVNLRQ